MEVLRSVMFGLLAVFLILDKTHWSASAQITAANISTLNDLIKQARTDANRTFWDNCPFTSVSDCSNLYSQPSDLPRCVCDRNQSQVEVLREQYKVCKEFAQLFDQLTSDIIHNLTVQLSSDLKYLSNSRLESVNAKFHQLKLEVPNVTIPATIYTDFFKRNTETLKIVARMVIEMDKMSKVLASL